MDHVVVYVIISFQSSIQQEASIQNSFLCLQPADCDSLHDFLPDALWIDILNILYENFAIDVSY